MRVRVSACRPQRSNHLHGSLLVFDNVRANRPIVKLNAAAVNPKKQMPPFRLTGGNRGRQGSNSTEMTRDWIIDGVGNRYTKFLPLLSLPIR